jgi:AhpD family alkylhydroperoxidase
MKTLVMRIPQTMNRFSELYKASTTKGILSSKTKELIELVIAIRVRCDRCIAYHVHDSLQAGANSEEVLETISVAVIMGVGPSVLYGCEAMEWLDEFVVLEKNEAAVQ